MNLDIISIADDKPLDYRGKSDYTDKDLKKGIDYERTDPAC